jgi:hypothetical protein
VLGRVRGIGLNDELGNGGERAAVHGNATERRFEGLDRGRGDAAHGNKVRRPDQHHALDRLGEQAEHCKSLCRHAS